jgi:hypothetical protein
LEEWVLSHADDPDRVRAFCLRHCIAELAVAAVQLAEGRFDPVERLSVGIGVDPEAREEWLAIRLVARMAPEEASRAYHAFLAEWVKAGPIMLREKVHLSYTVV